MEKIGAVCVFSFNWICDINKFEELEMNTDSPYLALAEKGLGERILHNKRADNFSPRTCCFKHQKKTWQKRAEIVQGGV